MGYPDICFTQMIGIRGVCEPKEDTSFWLDDIPGIDLDNLALVATPDAPSGATNGAKLLESAARVMAADVEAIYDSQYKVENMLVTGCSTCTFLGNYGTGNQRGITVKNNTSSVFSRLVLDTLTVRVNQTGTFHVVIDDGTVDNVRVIEQAFTASADYVLNNIRYRTKQSSFRIYMQEDVPLAQLSCPKIGSGCGCSGKIHLVQDLVFTGTLDGAEVSQAYGFIPCAYIQCEAADLLCFVANSSPRIMGLALLYKTAELYFNSTIFSTRNNKVAGLNVEEKRAEAKRYAGLYTDKLTGKNTRGIKDLVYSTLRSVNDSCVVCDALNKIAWAAG